MITSKSRLLLKWVSSYTKKAASQKLHVWLHLADRQTVIAYFYVRTCILDREKLLWPEVHSPSMARKMNGYMEVSWGSEGIDHTPYSKNTPLLLDQPSMKTFLLKNKVYSDH